MFGAEMLKQLCEAQQGTWSTTTKCDPAEWDIKCTQEAFSGVYVQYFPAGRPCVGGCEQAL